jgi:hypothetical protein
MTKHELMLLRLMLRLRLRLRLLVVVRAEHGRVGLLRVWAALEMRRCSHVPQLPVRGCSRRSRR